MSEAIQPPSACLFCRGREFQQVFVYRQPPAGEVRFVFSSRGAYSRVVWSCRTCGHMVSLHHMDEAELYAGDYVNSTYGEGGLKRAFDRINSLDPSRSDNVGRVKRINAFADNYLTAPAKESRKPTVLDVGSGLCVFLYRMKVSGWEGTALDPDERAVRHAREVVGVGAVQGDFLTVEGLGRYDVVTFNKVLEHVENPAAMLSRSSELLRPGGFVYVEVPDGEVAAGDGSGREEFFIDHHHIFSGASAALLARIAGFRLCLLERLCEPSNKFTLRAFLAPAPSSASGL